MTANLRSIGEFVASIEKLLFMKALAVKASEQCREDVELIVDDVLARAYDKPTV